MKLSRRQLVLGSLAGLAGAMNITSARAQPAVLARPIPSSGEQLPLVGLGSWITFNVGEDRQLLDECADVVDAFFQAGGRLIDTSPMYGSSQPTIGYALRKLAIPKSLFSADKVWTGDPADGGPQAERSRKLWGVERFDLLQVHNLLSWEAHLPMLLEMKAQDKVRYVGVTTSHGRRHGDVEHILATQPIDFVQISYNAVDREVEQRILPLAQERRIAVIVNRPFRQGELTRRLAREPLPPWAGEVEAASWAQLLLKFIIAHPAATCAIPATTRADHVRENVAAARDPLPDDDLRRRIVDYVQGL